MFDIQANDRIANLLQVALAVPFGLMATLGITAYMWKLFS